MAQAKKLMLFSSDQEAMAYATEVLQALLSSQLAAEGQHCLAAALVYAAAALAAGPCTLLSPCWTAGACIHIELLLLS